MYISAEELKAERLKKVFELHEIWLRSGGKRGKRAVITNTYMGHINMRYANLRYAILTGNDMRHTDMRHSNLSHAVLRCNDMTGTDMGFTYMTGTCIEDCIIPMACPSDGAFIGWKKAILGCGEAVLVKLLIPEDAKRSSATGRKCRFFIDRKEAENY